MLAVPQKKDIPIIAGILGCNENKILEGMGYGESVVSYIQRGVASGLVQFYIPSENKDRIVVNGLYGTEGAKLQLLRYLFNISDFYEIIHRSPLKDENTLDFYRKGLGIFPAIIDDNEYVYIISRRKRGFDDYYENVSRSKRASKLNSLCKDLANVASTGVGLYDYYNCSQYTKNWESDDRLFSTFWGASMSGKSTIPRMMIEGSNLVDIYDPFFTILDKGIVLVGTYPAHVRTSGPDTIKTLDSIKEIVRVLWKFHDVKNIVIEGLMAQQKTMIDFYRELSRISLDRKLWYFYFNASLDLIEDRLYKLRGKYIHEYTNRGANILGCHTRARQVAEQLEDDEDYNVLELDTTNRSEDEMFQQYTDAIGLYY